jgi:hypothetical protein
MTGVSARSNELGPKRLGFLRALLPNAVRIAALANPNKPNVEAEIEDLLAAGHSVGFVIVEGRAKTGRAAIGTISRRTERLVSAYLDKLGTKRLPDAILFRNRSGNPYRDDTLGDDFAAVRELVFPGDTRRLMDMRRSGVVEAIAGEVGPLGLSAKLANSIEPSNTLHKTYAPLRY